MRHGAQAFHTKPRGTSRACLCLFLRIATIKNAAMCVNTRKKGLYIRLFRLAQRLLAASEWDAIRAHSARSGLEHLRSDASCHLHAACGRTS